MTPINTNTETRKAFLTALREAGLDTRPVLTKEEIEHAILKYGIKWPYWYTDCFRVGRGEYQNLMVNPEPVTKAPNTKGASSKRASSTTVKRAVRGKKVFQPDIPTAAERDSAIPVESAPAVSEQTPPDESEAPKVIEATGVAAPAPRNLIPDVDPLFVPWGNYADLRDIIASGIFYPVFLTGLSGNGKTMSVEQACANLGRELIRVNITIETDEDDLIGGFRLQDGGTVWHNGPVVEAMERGALLLLDEIDLASNKIMCLQPVLEGKGIFIKKINRKVVPLKGFNIIATANTKGKGSEDGSFMGTNILNEAFLERFAITEEQEYPTEAIETQILKRLMTLNEREDENFAECLARWAGAIRKTFADGGISEVISTRRLVHIVNAFAIFGKKSKALTLCLNRFDVETKASFLNLYEKIDEQEAKEAQALREAEAAAAAALAANNAPETTANATSDTEEIPF